jgi:transcriptional regulator with XRE-family HTH domain
MHNRTIKHRINAEVIRNIRLSLGVTQTLFAKLLNRGIASLKRYEGGVSLPDSALISIFKLLVENPAYILQLYEQNKESFTENERQLLEAKFKELFPDQELSGTSKQLLKLMFRDYEGTDSTGNTPLQIEKLFNMILYFTNGGIYRAHLLKHLWYSDFLAYKRSGVSITGVPYIHQPNGPVPKNNDLILGCLESLEYISISEELLKEGDSRIVINARKLYSQICFHDGEMEVMRNVKDYFIDYDDPRDIIIFSQKERGWLETRDTEIISYSYAKELQLD